MVTRKIETVAEDNNRTGESPIWDASNERLLWVDIESSLVFQFSPRDKKKSVISRELNVAGIGLNRNGGMIFAGGTGLHLWYDEGSYRTIISKHESKLLCFNDMIVDARGRVYGGTLYWSEHGMEETGRLYLLETDWSIRVMDEGIQLSNGLAFSPDDRLLYYTDSATRCIYAYEFDIDTGDLRNRRTVVEVPAKEGIPDGMTVDAEGYIWSAHWYGGQVVRYDPDGVVERRIPMPVAQISSVAFGGPDLTDLYVTSAGEYWPSRLIPHGFDFKAPMGGSVYRIPLDIQGRAEHVADFSM